MKVNNMQEPETGLLYGRACAVCKKTDNKHLQEFRYICKPCLKKQKRKEREAILQKKLKNSFSHNRKIVFKKSKECYFCKSKKHLHVHHLDKNRNNNAVENLMVLCISCHFLVHRQMNEQVKFDTENFKQNYFVYKKLCQTDNSFLKRCYPLRSL